MKQSSTNIRDSVMEKIADHKIAMKSKTYFRVEFVLIAFVAAAVVFLTIALTGFIFFAPRINGHDSLILFGPRGFITFLLIFPWTLFLVDVLLVLFLSTLLRHFAFGYRKPILMLVGGVIVIGGVCGIVLDRETSLHDQLREEGRHGMLPPPIGGWYGQARGPVPHDEGIFRGTITSVNGALLTIQNDAEDVDDATSTHQVLLPPGTPEGFFMVGDTVYVYGDDQNDVVHAVGIRKLQ